MHMGNYGGKKPSSAMKSAALEMHSKGDKKGSKKEQFKALAAAAKRRVGKK